MGFNFMEFSVPGKIAFIVLMAIVIPIAITIAYNIVSGITWILITPFIRSRKNRETNEIITKREKELDAICTRNERAAKPTINYVFKKDKLNTMYSELARITSLIEKSTGDEPLQSSFDIHIWEKVSRYAKSELKEKAMKLKEDILSQEMKAYLLFINGLNDLTKDIRYEEAGSEGESFVFSHLNGHDEYKIIYGLTIKTNEHQHSESDMVIITQSGVFVVEIKNWHGGLYVGKDGLFSLNNNSISSPVKQNMEHLKNNKKLLIDEINKLGFGVDIPFYPLIVIANDELDLENESNDIDIIRAGSLTHYLYQKSREKVLSNEQQELIFDIFQRNNSDTMKVPYNSYIDELERLFHDICCLRRDNRMPEILVFIGRTGENKLDYKNLSCFCQGLEHSKLLAKLFYSNIKCLYLTISEYSEYWVDLLIYMKENGIKPQGILVSGLFKLDDGRKKEIFSEFYESIPNRQIVS